MEGKLVKKLKNGFEVVFNSGKFDDWCVYVNGVAPTDEHYFKEFLRISLKYDKCKLYDDFVVIYNETGKDIDEKVLDIINEIVETYKDEDKEDIEQWFVVIYAGMIAEENKKHTKLGKRIKRLGIHQLLKLNKSAKEAADFSKGKKWDKLNDIMKDLGF